MPEPSVKPLYAALKILPEGYFYYYSSSPVSYLSVLNSGYTGLGVIGDLLADNTVVTDAIPVYLMGASYKNAFRARLVFSIEARDAYENFGWTYEGRLGYLLPDGSKYAAQGTVPVYSLGTLWETGAERSYLATSKEDYDSAQRGGWVGEGKVGNHKIGPNFSWTFKDAISG